MEIIRSLQLHWDLEPDSLRRCVIFLFWRSTKADRVEGAQETVLFPKIVFLYDENLHGPGKPCEDILKPVWIVQQRRCVSGLAVSDRQGLYRQRINGMAKLSAQWGAVHS